MRDRPAQCYNINQLSLKTVDKKRVVAMIKEGKSEKCAKKHSDQMEVEKINEDQIDPAKPYEKIIIVDNQVDEDIQCDICLEYDYEDDDCIVICDLC